MDTGQDKTAIGPHTWVEVEVTNKGRPIKEDGKIFASGARLMMTYHRAHAHVEAKMVKVVAVVPGYDPKTVPTEELVVEPPAEPVTLEE